MQTMRSIESKGSVTGCSFGGL